MEWAGAGQRKKPETFLNVLLFWGKGARGCVSRQVLRLWKANIRGKRNIGLSSLLRNPWRWTSRERSHALPRRKPGKKQPLSIGKLSDCDSLTTSTLLIALPPLRLPSEKASRNPPPRVHPPSSHFYFTAPGSRPPAYDRRTSAEAEEEVRELEALNPYSAAVWYWKGLLDQERGHLAEAQASYRHAIQLAIDISGASNQLWEIAQGSEAHFELLSFLEQELKRQSFGEYGFSNWFELAATMLDADDLEMRLREFRTSRETSWIVWQSSVRHAVNQGKNGVAAILLDELISRFSLTPGTWSEAGNLQKRLGRFDPAESPCGEQCISIRFIPQDGSNLPRFWRRQAAEKMRWLR